MARDLGCRRWLGLVTAISAFALAAPAVASAHHVRHQRHQHGSIAKKHKKHTKRKTPTGARGPRGPQGKAGANGARGDRGETGPRGETGARGETGPRGEAGLSALATLPSGRSESGQIGAVGNNAVSGQNIESTVTFPVPLAEALPESHVIFTGESATHCSGQGHADAGYLCIYVNWSGKVEPSNVLTFEHVFEHGAGRTGFGAFWRVTENGEAWAEGTWTVTAP